MQKLRLVHMPQLGADIPTFTIDVDNPYEAWKLANVLADYDLFQFNHRIKPDYCNETYLEVWDETNKEWCSWEDEEGKTLKDVFYYMDGSFTSEG